MPKDIFTGFDSEADRRDAIRREIVQDCVREVRTTIAKHGPTKAREERRYLEIAVAIHLLEGLRQEDATRMWYQEIADAEKEIGE